MSEVYFSIFYFYGGLFSFLETPYPLFSFLKTPYSLLLIFQIYLDGKLVVQWVNNSMFVNFLFLYCLLTVLFFVVVIYDSRTMLWLWNI